MWDTERLQHVGHRSFLERSGTVEHLALVLIGVLRRATRRSEVTYYVTRAKPHLHPAAALRASTTIHTVANNGKDRRMSVTIHTDAEPCRTADVPSFVAVMDAGCVCLAAEACVRRCLEHRNEQGDFRSPDLLRASNVVNVEGVGRTLNKFQLERYAEVAPQCSSSVCSVVARQLHAPTSYVVPMDDSTVRCAFP